MHHSPYFTPTFWLNAIPRMCTVVFSFQHPITTFLKRRASVERGKYLQSKLNAWKSNSCTHTLELVIFSELFILFILYVIILQRKMLGETFEDSFWILFNITTKQAYTDTFIFFTLNILHPDRCRMPVLFST